MGRVLIYTVLFASLLVLDGLNRRVSAQDRVASTPETALAVSLSLIQEPVPSDATGNVELALTNRSSKPVIAYSLEVIRSVDGVVRPLGVFTEDFVPSFAGVSRKPLLNSKYQHMGPLQPGQQRFMALGLNTSAGLQSLTYRVKAVAFADGTGIGDPEVLKSIFDSHAAASDELMAVLATLRGLSRSRLHEQVSTLQQTLAAGGKIPEASGRVMSSPRLRPNSAPPTPARNLVLHELTEALRHYNSEVEMQPWWNYFVPYLEDQEKAYREHSIFVGVQP